MSRRTQIIAGLVLAAVGALTMLVVTVAGTGSVRQHIDDNYKRVSSTAGGRSREYTSMQSPSRVVADIAGDWTPAQRHVDASGYFLRYRDTIVAVTPVEPGGSRVFVDDEDRGYQRWYPHIGGYWGTYSGPAEGFRGGGPGGGK